MREDSHFSVLLFFDRIFVSFFFSPSEFGVMFLRIGGGADFSAIEVSGMLKWLIEELCCH